LTTYQLKTPISEETARKLKANDIVYLSGTIVTARDQAHKRALQMAKEGKPLPLSLEGLAVYHCGPVMAKQEGKWVAIAAGPTTSTRLDAYEDAFMEIFKPRILIGKGGMGKKTTDALAKVGAVYCAFTGGAAVLAAKGIKSVVGVEWLDLGMPEAMWIFKVEEFGPLIAAIDSHGRNLFSDVAAKAEANRLLISKKLGL
jgi:tartrate/fumarate subfamily iron-sulfur-dependent hydro-lyase beta chain